jgi:ribonuclease HI
MNKIPSKHSVGLFWVHGHSRVCGNEIANKLTRDGTVCQFVGPELALGISKQNKKKINAEWTISIWQCGSRYRKTGLKTDFGP